MTASSGFCAVYVLKNDELARGVCRATKVDLMGEGIIKSEEMKVMFLTLPLISEAKR